MIDEFEGITRENSGHHQETVDASDDVVGRGVMDREFGGDRSHGVDTSTIHEPIVDILGELEDR